LIKDLYSILGVEKDATEAQIKKAYRKLAMDKHPDKNPDSPRATFEFQELNEAYEVLIDPERRRKYEETGSTDNKAFDFLFNQFVSQHVNEMMSRDESLLESTDMMKEIIRDTNNKIDAMKQFIADVKKDRAKAVKLKKRITKKGDDNVFATMIQNHINEHDKLIAGNEQQIKDYSIILEMLSDYNYRVDKQDYSFLNNY